MATTPDLQEPQIAAARAKAWHQPTDSGEPATPLLTMEAVRAFVNEFGLVLFAPRPLGAPAPSLVEATLGAAKAVVSPVESETARSLVARLVAEGSALPLNLLGGPGDLPDFVVSTAAFPFVFTLRGDKGWKRPPETSGAVKVTPLGLRVYELLTERGAMTVPEMVPEIGREVTESAVLRALGELWAMLRVIPAPQPGGGETLWELTTTRFAKAVKAGANAGQPTALSALVSLYLRQVFLATEEEIASFLSPLTARSRVRDVLHGLTAGRQLSEAVLEGKSVLYIPDALPDFGAHAPLQGGAEPDAKLDQGLDDNGADEPTEATAAFDAEEIQAAPAGGGESRIRRFEAGPGASLRGKPQSGSSQSGKPLRGKPTTREGGGRAGSRPSGPRPSSPRPSSPRPSGPRPSASRPYSPGAPAGGGDRPRRSFEGSGGASDRPARPARPARPKRLDDDEAATRRPTGDRPSFTRPWDEEQGSRSSPERGAGRPPRSGGESRPPRREGSEERPFRPSRARDEARPPRRDAARPPFRRESGNSDQARPPFRRETGSARPSFGGREKREGERPSRPFASADRSGAPPDRGERRAFTRERPFRGDRPAFPDRGDRGGDRRADRGANQGSDRPRSSRPPADGSAPPRPFPSRPFVNRGGSSSEPRSPRREGGGPASFDRSRGDRPSGPPRTDRPFSDRPRREGSFNRGSGRPSAEGGARPNFRPRPSAAGAPGPGGFSRGPKRDFPGKGSSRGPGGARGPAAGQGSDRPAPRRKPQKPEDEA